MAVVIDKVRLFVTPTRMKKGDRECQGTCPIALAALESLGFKSVSVGIDDIVGVGGPLGAARLTPVTNSHSVFISDFDRGKLTPQRKNFTYEVERLPRYLALNRIDQARLDDERVKKSLL